MIKIEIVIVRSSLSFQRTLNPTLILRSDVSPISSAKSRASLPRFPTRKKAIANAAKMKRPPATQKELTAPTVEIKPAPTAGPKIHETPINPSCIPFSRSSSISEALATSAKSVLRAV